MKRLKSIFILPIALLISGSVFAQIGVNTNNQVNSTVRATTNAANIQQTANRAATQTAQTTGQTVRAAEQAAQASQTHVVGAQVNGKASTTAQAATDDVQPGVNATTNINGSANVDAAKTVERKTKAAEREAKRAERKARKAERKAAKKAHEAGSVQLNSNTNVHSNAKGSASSHHAAMGASTQAQNNTSVQAGKVKANAATTATDNNKVDVSDSNK